MSIAAGVNKEPMAYSYLVLPGHDVSSETVTILAGQGPIAEGTVLGKITANGKYIVSLSAASDGSQVPDKIASHAIPASVSDQPAVVYTEGRFNQAAAVLGAGHTVASVKEGLRVKGIFLEAMVAAN